MSPIPAFAAAAPLLRTPRPNVTKLLVSPRSPHPTPPRTMRRATPRANLVGVPDLSQPTEPDAKEVLLAEMRYSDPSLLPSIVKGAMHLLDEDFYKFIEEQIVASVDIEERETLRSLRDAITDIMQQMLNAASAKKEAAVAAMADAQPEADAADTTTTIEAAPVSAAAAAEAATATYDDLIDSFVAAHSRSEVTGLATSVQAAYDRIDMQFLTRLTSRIDTAGSDSSALTAVRDEITKAMSERMASAAENLKTVLQTQGGPPEMRRAVDTLVRRGELDDAFIQLLDANRQQAEQAGASGPAQVLGVLLEHAASVRDIVVDPEIRLIRALLRTDDSDARLQMLEKNLSPRGSVSLTDGSKTAGVSVDGKKFVTAMRSLIEDYGHVDDEFKAKLSQIGEEAEQVARKIFDMEGKDVKDLQEEAFHKRSVSIWDLEQYEHDELMSGREAPWEGQLGSIPKNMGFGEDGKLSV